MIRSYLLAATAAVAAATGTCAFAADPLPTATYKLLPAALAASLKQLIVEKLSPGAAFDLAVRDGRTGFTFFNVDAPPDALNEIERQERLSEDVLRYLTIRVDEHEEGPSAMMRKADRDREREERGFGFRDRDRGGFRERGEHRRDRDGRGGRENVDDPAAEPEG